jgi:hypothetical protein
MQEFYVIITVSKNDYGIIIFRGESSGTSRHLKFRSLQDLRNVFSYLALQPNIIDEIEKMCAEVRPENVRREKMFLPEYVFEALSNLPTVDGIVLMADVVTVLSKTLPPCYKVEAMNATRA